MHAIFESFGCEGCLSPGLEGAGADEFAGALWRPALEPDCAFIHQYIHNEMLPE